jgi:hypothetical protein
MQSRPDKACADFVPYPGHHLQCATCGGYRKLHGPIESIGADTEDDEEEEDETVPAAPLQTPAAARPQR